MLNNCLQPFQRFRFNTCCHLLAELLIKRDFFNKDPEQFLMLLKNMHRLWLGRG